MDTYDLTNRKYYFYQSLYLDMWYSEKNDKLYYLQYISDDSTVELGKMDSNQDKVTLLKWQIKETSSSDSLNQF